MVASGKVAASVLLCVLLAATALGEAEVSKSTLQKLVKDPLRDYGIVRLDIPGLHFDIEVILHLYLRAIRDGNHVDIHGIAHIEGVREVHLQGGPQIAEPWDCRSENQNLTVSGHSQLRAVIANFTVIEADLYPSVRPKLLKLRLTDAEFSKLYWVSFNEGTRHACVGDSLQRYATSKPEPGTMGAVIVLPPPFGLKPTTAAELLRFHLEYHRKAGFSGEIMYSRTSQVVELTPEIVGEVDSGFFSLMSWTEAESGIALPAGKLHKGHPLSYYDQSVIYNHALLSYWARNTLLFFIDLDEFFYTPKPSGIEKLINDDGCLVPTRHQSKIRRFFAVCTECDPKADWRTWSEVGSLKFLSRYNTLWRKQDSEFADVWDLKTLADPDVTRHFHVHWGQAEPSLVPEGDKIREGVPENDCALLIHFMNLFLNRLNVNSEERDDISTLQAVVAGHSVEGFTKLPLDTPSFLL